MEHQTNSNYTFFDEIPPSKEFLSFILGNMNSTLVVLNNNMEVQAFSNPLTEMFAHKKSEYLLYKRFGEAIGCEFQVEEKNPCGETSRCKNCSLRLNAMEALTKKKTLSHKSLVRDFYTTDGSKQNLHLVYSIKPFYHKNQYHLMVLLEEDKTRAFNKTTYTNFPTESYYS